jgi:hypothetical protein
VRKCETDVFDAHVLYRRSAEDFVDMARAALSLADGDGPAVNRADSLTTRQHRRTA